jgi:hypothetical protein
VLACCAGVVLRMPWYGCLMCPLELAGFKIRCLVTPFAVRLGHPLGYPHKMAFNKNDSLGLHTIDVQSEDCWLWCAPCV